MGQAAAPLDRPARIRLARMTCRLFQHWQIDVPTQARLRGLSRQGNAIYRYRHGGPLPKRRDLLDRVGLLFGIHKALRLTYPQDRELAYRWPTARNKTLNDRSPVDVMLKHGLPGLAAVHGYLAFLLDL